MVHITNTDANTFEIFLFVELTGTPWRDWACRGISQKLKKRFFLAGCGPAHLQESSFGLHWTCSMHRIEACFEEKSQLHFSGIQYHFWISLNWSFGIRTEKGRTTAGQKGPCTESCNINLVTEERMPKKYKNTNGWF